MSILTLPCRTLGSTGALSNSLAKAMEGRA
jgi:hypothetical protein